MIISFFGKPKATEQSIELVKATEARDDLSEDEKARLASEVSAELKKSSRTGVKLNTYTDKFISEMLKRVQDGSQKKALKWAREAHGFIIPKTTLSTWVNNRKNQKIRPGEELQYKSQNRGRPSDLSEEVEKFALNNLKVYQEKGVTITSLVVKHVCSNCVYNVFPHTSLGCNDH